MRCAVEEIVPLMDKNDNFLGDVMHKTLAKQKTWVLLKEEPIFSLDQGFRRCFVREFACLFRKMRNFVICNQKSCATRKGANIFDSFPRDQQYVTLPD